MLYSPSKGTIHYKAYSVFFVFIVLSCLSSCSDNSVAPGKQDGYKLLHFSTQLTFLDQSSGKTEKAGGVIGTAQKAVFSTDGELVLSIQASGTEGRNRLYVSDPSGANPVVVPGSAGVFLANFSPDANYVSFLNGEQLSIHNRTTGETQPIELGGLFFENYTLPPWFAGRNTIVSLVSESLFANFLFFIEYDPATKTFEQISDSMKFSFDLSSSPDGNFLIFANSYWLNSASRHAIRRLNIGDRQPQTLLDCGWRRIANVALSPNGEWISFLHQVEEGYDNYELFVMRSDGTDLKQLTDLISELDQPVWRPDSEGIALLSQYELSGRKIYYYNLQTGRNSVVFNASRISFHTWAPSISSGF